MNKNHAVLLLIILTFGFHSAKGQDSLRYVIIDTIPVEHTLNTTTDNTPTPFEPVLESVVFVPKGQWVTGVSVNWTQSNQNDYQFLVLENLSGDTYSFKLSPMLIYIVANDLGFGGKFSYTRSLTKLENASIVMGDDTEYDMSHIYRLSHNYYAMAVMRNYFSLGKSKQFGFFNELQLQIGGGQSKMTKGSGQALTGAYERNLAFNIGLAPGLIMFLNNYSALEVNVGVLGFSYTHTKQINDRIYVSNRKTKYANFRINLFSITFGVAFYL